MAIKTTEESKVIQGNTIVKGYTFDDNSPDQKTLVYEINKNKRTIEFFPHAAKYYFFDRITLNGFITLPEILKKNGGSKNKVLDYINRMFSSYKIKSLTINRTGTSQIISRGKTKHLHLAHSTLSTLSEEIGSMNFYHGRRRTQTAAKIFSQDFPKLLKLKPTKKGQEEIKAALQMLNAQTIEDYKEEDIIRITDILSSLMKSNFRSKITQSELFKATKLKIDTVTFTEVIDQFEQKLSKKTTEASWGKFLEDNLFLIDSKYIHTIPQLNLVLGGSRKVDFGLIDIQGYLDIFEIKKPETKLLSSKKDGRGNYVWDKQAIEAIVQAEKYLFHAESKRSILKEDIKRERQIDLDVIRPRAFVIMGNSKELDNDAKKEDFRILKNQFKNLEIILYDELLERIKNQKKSLE